MTDAIILIDKQAGWTSFDVCAKIRSRIKAEYRMRGEKPTKRQLRVGHAGTLDPFATGLLVVLLGDATKKADEFLKLDKWYEATINLGATSSTGDPEGEVIHTSDVVPTLNQINAIISQFLGEITQRPPIFSAIKINGRRAYDLARQGKSIQMPERTVSVYSLEVLDYTYPHLTIRVHVSSGTYIRSLAVDIGRALGTEAYCKTLRRTKIDQWSVIDAKSLADFGVTS